MIVHAIESFDFFSQFVPYIRCQGQAADLLLCFFQGQDCTESEKMLYEQSTVLLKKLTLQKRMELFPPEKRKYCICLTELSFNCQQVLFRIPRLCRLYNTPALNEHLLPLAECTKEISTELVTFCAPKRCCERFANECAERLMTLCLFGITLCKGLLTKEKLSTLSGVQWLIFKDLVDEFSGYCSLCIQFTHWGLLFPL